MVDNQNPIKRKGLNHRKANSSALPNCQPLDRKIMEASVPPVRIADSVARMTAGVSCCNAITRGGDPTEVSVLMMPEIVPATIKLVEDVLMVRPEALSNTAIRINTEKKIFKKWPDKLTIIMTAMAAPTVRPMNPNIA